VRRAAAAFLVLAACSTGRDDNAAPPTMPTTAAPTTTTASTTTTTAPDPSCPGVPPRAEPPADRPRYTLRIDVRPGENVVVGDVTVRFTPDLETDRLVFRLWPNGPRTAAGGAELAVTSVTIDGTAATSRRPDATTLVVPTRVAAGRTVEAAVGWRLTLPRSLDDRISRHGDAIRLGSFYPVLAWERGHGWAVEPATSGFAESSTPVTADYTAHVTVPPGLDVLATGTPDGTGTWSATAVQDFALSVGRFTTATGTASAPAPVQVTVGVHEGMRDRPEAYLDRVVRALEDFARRFGPYPWPALTFALTPELGGGIEYPMHVMQGPDTIGRTTPHEVGHQWFYALVASNQGRDPWLDEGLATWAEARFEDEVRLLRSRTIPTAGRGRTAEPMAYWERRQSIYYRSVYLQGAQALAALGPPDLVDCALRHYVARNAYRVARPADLVAAVVTVFPNAPDVLARYGIRT
jgi:aminopeptidase N